MPGDSVTISLTARALGEIERLLARLGILRGRWPGRVIEDLDTAIRLLTYCGFVARVRRRVAGTPLWRFVPMPWVCRDGLLTPWHPSRPEAVAQALGVLVGLYEQGSLRPGALALLRAAQLGKLGPLD